MAARHRQLVLALLGCILAVAVSWPLRDCSIGIQLLAAGLAFVAPAAVAEAVDALDPPSCVAAVVFDPHGPASHNGALAAALAAEPGLQLVVSPGDIADSGDLYDEWFDQPFAEVLRRVPWYSAGGNHDYATAAGAAAFAERFGILPRAVTCGTVDFFLLPWEPNRHDIEWLTGALARSTATYRVLVVHRPLWEPAGAGALQRGLLRPALDRIDLVLAGHSHVHWDSTHDVGGRQVRQWVDASGPKLYDCTPQALAAGVICGSRGYLRLEARRSGLRLVRRELEE